MTPSEAPNETLDETVDLPAEQDAPSQVRFDGLLKRAFAVTPPPDGLRADLRSCAHCGAITRRLESQCLLDGGYLVPVADPLLGEVVGAYRLLERVGSGGAGSVYRARHRSLGREAAVKFLRPELATRADHRARLAREARVMGRLDHDHVVKVLDFVTDWQGAAGHEAAPVLIMEFLRGRTLAEAIEQDGPFDPGRAVHVARQMAAALSRTHELGVMHRDIKPSNVLLTRVGDRTDFAKVLDFGIARSVVDEALTHPEAVLGTPYYMAPEQAERATLGPQSDLYALGCVLFEMLTGRPPFLGGAVAVVRAHMDVDAPCVTRFATGVPAPLASVVAKLLSKEPSRRFANAHQLIDELCALYPDPYRESAAPRPSPTSIAPTPEPALEGRLSARLRVLEHVTHHGAPPEWTSTDVPNQAPRVVDLRDRARAASETLARAGEAMARASEKASAERHRMFTEHAELERTLTGLAHELRQVETECALLRRQQEQLEGAERAMLAELASCLQQLDDGQAESDDVLHVARTLTARAAACHDNRTSAAAGQERATLLHRDIESRRARLASMRSEFAARQDARATRIAVLTTQHQAALEDTATAVDTLETAITDWQVPTVGT